MKVAILCGGKGSRIREVSESIPKPMIPIGSRPVLWHIMKVYSHFGLNDFVLLLGYKGEVIRDFFLNFSAYTCNVTVDLQRMDEGRLTVHRRLSEPWRVTLVDTGLESMTGARLLKAREFLDGGESFCATYGDGVGDIDIASLLAFHRSHGKLATLTAVRPPSRFGELLADGDRVAEFQEKPQITPGLISGGFFVFNRGVFDGYFEEREDLMLEREPLVRLSQDRQLMMFRHEGFWQPMDTPREHELLTDLWNRGEAPWKLWKD